MEQARLLRDRGIRVRADIEEQLQREESTHLFVDTETWGGITTGTTLTNTTEMQDLNYYLRILDTGTVTTTTTTTTTATGTGYTNFTINPYVGTPWAIGGAGGGPGGGMTGAGGGGIYAQRPRDMFSSMYDIQQNDRARLRKVYKEWSDKNTCVKAKELNSNYGYFKRQNWTHSLEVLLLEAIARKEYLKTKTTEHDPNRNTVKFLDSEILVYNPISFRVESICLPSFATKAENDLVRHRLRQLGVRCKRIKGNVRIYKNETDYVIVRPFEVYNFPTTHNVYCLPPLWRARVCFSLPAQQFDLFELSQRIKLDQFSYRYGRYLCKFELEVTPNAITIYGMAQYTAPSNFGEVYLQIAQGVTPMEWTNLGLYSFILELQKSLNRRIDTENITRKHKQQEYSIANSTRTTVNWNGLT